MASKTANFVTGVGRVLNVKDIADIYRDVVNLSIPNSGKIQQLAENNFSLTCRFSATDCDSLESIKTSKAYSLTTASRNSDRHIQSVRCITDPQVLAELSVSTSENGRFLARLRGAGGNTGGSADKRQLLEIWDRSKLVKTFDISEIDLHGLINTDPTFGSIQWCPFGEQDKLLYVCQKKPLKYQSFFKQPTVKITKNQEDQSDGLVKAAAAGAGKGPNLGEENVRAEDWGECLKGIEHTLVAMLDVSDNCKITVVDVDGYSLGDTKWISSVGGGDQCLKTISVAYLEEPKRLGLSYCNNRPSKLIVHDWSQSPAIDVLNLNSDTHCFHTPRVSHCGKKLIYLAAPLFGPHKHSVKIHFYDLETGVDRELVDKETKQNEFFVETLNQNCFSANDKHILFVEHDHLFQHMCLYSLEESKKTRIKFPTTGLSLLDFRYDIILATGSEVDATPTLFVSVLSPIDPAELVAWHQIEDCIHLDEINYKSYTIPTPDKSSFVSACLVSPNVSLVHKNFSQSTAEQSDDANKFAKNTYDLPTVVHVHGGPHSAFTLAYMPSLVLYARLGLRSLLINYRGSTGVSEDYVKSLSGRVGELDVADCLHVIRHLVNEKTINPNKLIIQGGSHGGFLTAHLCCQEESKFSSAIMRNPVIDISTMHETTDIPDWCSSVALGQDKFDHRWMPNIEDLAKMFKASPMSKYSQANVPTLMLLGSKDYRVPMFQGERWVELLRARGIKTLCKVYEDKHDLAKVDVATDCTMTAIMWILSNLQANTAQ